MNRFRWNILLLTLMMFALGCATSEFSGTSPHTQASTNGYCHKVFQPIGPTDVARPTQSRAGDYIDYYGPCEGPSPEEQIRKQKRFERFRFGRDFMPG